MTYDQAIQLRQLVSGRAAGHAVAAVPLVVVAGGAGCGVTSAAWNLAVALARQGRRAVFVDADLQSGNRLRVAAQADFGSIVDVLAGRRSVHEVLSRGPLGVQIVPGAALADDARANTVAAHNRLITELGRLAPHADVIVMDVGASRGGLAVRCCQSARAVCAVTTPADRAVLECYATIKLLLQGRQRPLHAIVNRAAQATEARDVQTRMATACQRFLRANLSDLGNLPVCDELQHRFEPATASEGDSARWFDRAAETLWAQLQDVGTGHGSRLSNAAVASC